MNYLAEVEKAIDFIEENLKETITLQTVAAHTCFSMYHFHRIFHAMVGESITDYIRKRRLTEAAKLILTTDTRLIDICFEFQYQSQEAFTRAFKSLFGVTPGQYRQGRKVHLFLNRKILTRENLLHLQRGITMEPKIINKEQFHVIGLEYFGANKNNEIPQLWDEFLKRIGEIPNRTNKQTSMGVCSPMAEMTNENEFFYAACVEVSTLETLPEGMIGKTVPANQYAVFTHKGDVENLCATYEFIYGTWLPNSSFEPAFAPDFELYDERFNPGFEDSEMDIYIPINPLTKA